jgi:hypothetical protein
MKNFIQPADSGSLSLSIMSTVSVQFTVSVLISGFFCLRTHATLNVNHVRSFTRNKQFYSTMIYRQFLNSISKSPTNVQILPLTSLTSQRSLGAILVIPRVQA